MIKNVIEVKLESIIRNYSESITDMLLSNTPANSKESVEFLQEARSRFEDVIGMLDKSSARNTVRRLFSEGFVFCLMPKQMELLEQWEKDNFNYVIVVEIGDDEHTVVTRSEMTW